MPVPPGFSEHHTPVDEARLLGDLLADSSSWTDGEFADAVVALDRLRSEVDAAYAVAAARWDANAVWAADGAQSGAGWLNSHGETTKIGARVLLKRGRTLRYCPAVTAAYRQGLIGTAKVDLMFKARKGCEDLFGEHETDLVEQIRPLTVEQAAIVLRYWRRLATQGDDDTEPADTTDTVGLAPTLGGRFDVTGNLDGLAGKIWLDAIAAEIDTMFKNGVAHKDDGFTHGQRQAQALTELIRRGALPTTNNGAIRPLVHVIVDEATLRGDSLDDVTQTLHRRCELAGHGGGPIPVATAQRLICEGNVTRITTRTNPDGTTTVLDASPATRSATRRQRNALRERDHGCVFPGCDIPVEWCDAHHIHPYETGGPTIMDNLVLLCRFHHHQVHEGGFRLTRPDGVVTVHRPDGTLLATGTPHGHQPPLEPVLAGEPNPPARPKSRFRPLAERLTEDEQEARWCRKRTLQRAQAFQRRDGDGDGDSDGDGDPPPIPPHQT